MAADAKLRNELLEVGPYCVAEDATVVYCSANASRTQRAGVYDVEYMGRADRSYCELQFSRERLTPESGADIEACRLNLTERVRTCYLECDTCKAECTSAAARGLVSGWRCSFALPTLGLAAAFHSTDIGQDVQNRWGAVRTELQPPVPDKSYAEQHSTMVQNSLDRPRAPRNAISCRKSHRESTTGGYVPALNKKGEYGQRAGFLVSCKTDVDCYSRCGEHPIHGSPYVCTHHLDFYTHAGWGKDTYVKLATEAYALAAAGKPHRRVWRPDMAEPEFYLVEEPGDDKYDPTDGETGVCTDVHINYGNTGCFDPDGAKFSMSVTGCSGRFFGWATSFCGALVEHSESDFVSGVGISESSLEYPRTLIPEAQVNGVVEPAIKCDNGIECQRKCEFYEMTARSGGLPAPEACALCRPPCPSNGGTWLIDFSHALIADIGTALKLAAICFNPVACACQVFMMMKPAWLDNLPDEMSKCRGGDVFGLIFDKIMSMIVQGAEDIVNDVIGSVNDFVDSLPFPLDGIGRPIAEVCFPYKDHKLCPSDPQALEALFGCSVSGPLHERCYYE